MSSATRTGNDDVYDLVAGVAAEDPTLDGIAGDLRRLAASDLNASVGPTGPLRPGMIG